MSHVLRAALVTAIIAAGGRAHADPAPTRWLSLGALSQAQQYDATRGMWAEANLVDVNGWIFSGSAVLDEGTVGIYDQSRTALLDRRDQKGVLSIGRTSHYAKFEIRGALGAGIVHTSASGEMTNLGTMTQVNDDKWTPVAEASARVTVPISPYIAITAGPTATYYDQYFKFVGGTEAGATHRLAELVFFGGLAIRL